MERRSFVEDGVLREIPLNSVLSTRLSQDSEVVDVNFFLTWYHMCLHF